MPMLQQIDLRALSKLEGPERAFVSFYFSGDEGLASLEQREKVIRAMLEDEADELLHFDESMKLVRQLIEENPGKLDSKGVCLFACWALDFAEGYPLPVEVPTMLHIGPAPYLRPLAELQDEHENFVVVAADNRSTRIFLVTSATVEEPEQVKGGVKNHVRKGGWSQQRYERRRRNHLLHYAKEVGQVLLEMSQQEPFDRIVLLGAEGTINEIEKELPTQLADKAISKQAIDLGNGDAALLDDAYRLYFEQEREAEAQTWDQIREAHFHGGLAVAGATRVLEAAQTGRIDTMLVTRDAAFQGTRCRDCEALVHGTPQTCQSCGSRSLFQVDLVDELVRLVEQTSGEVDFVHEIPGLTKVGGVAAMLRW